MLTFMVWWPCTGSRTHARLFLLFFLPPFSFGVLSLNQRQYLGVVAWVLGLYAALLDYEYIEDPQGFNTQYQLFLYVLFGIQPRYLPGLRFKALCQPGI